MASGRLRTRAAALPLLEPSTRAAAVSVRAGLVGPEDWDGESSAAREAANPASWVTVAGLEQQRQGLPDLAFRRFDGNQWDGRRVEPAAGRAWHGCVATPRLAPGERIWTGVDVGGETAGKTVGTGVVSVRLHDKEGRLWPEMSRTRLVGASPEVSEVRERTPLLGPIGSSHGVLPGAVAGVDGGGLLRVGAATFGAKRTPHR